MKVVIKGREAQIDEEFEYLLEFFTLCYDRAGYLKTTCNLRNLIICEEFGYERSQIMLFHRLIFQVYLGRKLQGDEFIDHINRDKLDNRIKNLRIVNHSANMKNKKIKSNQVYHNVYYCKYSNYFIFNHGEAKISKRFKELRLALEYFTEYDNQNANVLTKYIHDIRPIDSIKNIVLEQDAFCEKCGAVLWCEMSLRRHQKEVCD